MARNWTPQQQWAIDAPSGNLLVSAAAGSGKTSVLVARVIRRLTDPVSPVSADRLLIVTFTRAAAAEVRQRTTDAVAQRVASDPDNERLAEQQMLLPYAKICTIDAFCSQLVRAHFEALDLPPDFKNADEGELQLLSEQAMSETLEDCYAEGDTAFSGLVELLFQGRDDSFLEETIRALYRESRSNPFPSRWLSEIAAFYHGEPTPEHPFLREVASRITGAAKDMIRLAVRAKEETADDDVLTRIFAEAFASDRRQLEGLLAAMENGDWDGARAAAESYAPVTLGRTPKEYQGDLQIERLKALRQEIKDTIRKKIAPLFCCSMEAFREDLRFFAPMIDRLVQTTEQYAARFAEIKREKQCADFSDILHYALQLLYTEGEDGSFTPSDRAREIAQDYDEILIDEYQDTNRAQDMLFAAIARDNLFRVGDMKQSIYRFRQAMPEIFLELKDAYPPYDPDRPAFPAQIGLMENFRSRAGVTEIVNFLFSQVMSRRAGDVDYSDGEALVCAARYPQADECCELHVLDVKELDSERDDNDAYQADYVAKRIRTMVDEGFEVFDGEKMRPAQYADFCILLRSINGGRGALYADALTRQGVPCFTEVSTDFFSAHEVSLLLNLLRVIDNPKQDVPLLSVLLSVLFGFSPDDCARLRLLSADGDLYTCLVRDAQNGGGKAARFLEKIRSWRTLGVCMAVPDFLQMIYDETAVLCAVSAMPGAQAKRMNLMLLLDYAAVYEAAGYIGLSGFIRFIDRLERTKGDLAGSVGVSSETNVVRVMSIHKSKGLEFPICILANCTGKFNLSDRARGVALHATLGVGAQRREPDTRAQYPTLPLLAVRQRSRRDTISEELRVLYVAMTRAKERLILVGACRDLEKTMAKYHAKLSQAERRFSPFSVLSANSYADWIFPALLRHPDAEALREAGGYSASIVLPASSKLRIHCETLQPAAQTAAQSPAAQEPDPACRALLDESLSWRYAYEPLTRLVSKRAASEVDKAFVDRDYFAASVPAFLTEGGLSPAQRGTATHTFMQYADFSKAETDVDGEIARLCDKGVISQLEADAINRAAVRRFFASDLYRRMRQSELIMREKKFTVALPVSSLYPETAAFPEENVLIQGIADCAFLENGALVVVDYKTDRLETDAQFTEKYAGQVRLYKRALSLCTDYPVRETVLYSFHLGRAIPVDGA